MTTVRIRKFLMVAALVGFSVVATGKGLSSGFPGGPSSVAVSMTDARSIAGEQLPRGENPNGDVYGNGLPSYFPPAGGMAQGLWGLDVDY